MFPPSKTAAELLDEASRPRAAVRPGSSATPDGAAGAQMLVQIHDHLRDELKRLRDAVATVADGKLTAAAARSLVNELTMRQNYWSLGAFCAAYCRILTVHHSLEDRYMFGSLREAEGDLSPVLDKLSAEHEVIAEVLERVDTALVEMVADESRLDAVRGAVDLLSEVLLSHLAYEEAELLDPIGRHGIAI